MTQRENEIFKEQMKIYQNELFRRTGLALDFDESHPWKDLKSEEIPMKITNLDENGKKILRYKFNTENFLNQYHNDESADDAFAREMKNMLSFADSISELAEDPDLQMRFEKAYDAMAELYKDHELNKKVYTNPDSTGELFMAHFRREIKGFHPGDRNEKAQRALDAAIYATVDFENGNPSVLATDLISWLNQRDHSDLLTRQQELFLDPTPGHIFSWKEKKTTGGFETKQEDWEEVENLMEYLNGGRYAEDPKITHEQTSAMLRLLEWNETAVYTDDDKGGLCIVDASEDFNGDAQYVGTYDFIGNALDAFNKASDYGVEFSESYKDLLKPVFDLYKKTISLTEKEWMEFERNFARLPFGNEHVFERLKESGVPAIKDVKNGRYALRFSADYDVATREWTGADGNKIPADKISEKCLSELESFKKASGAVGLQIKLKNIVEETAENRPEYVIVVFDADRGRYAAYSGCAKETADAINADPKNWLENANSQEFPNGTYKSNYTEAFALPNSICMQVVDNMNRSRLASEWSANKASDTLAKEETAGILEENGFKASFKTADNGKETVDVHYAAPPTKWSLGSAEFAGGKELFEKTLEMLSEFGEKKDMLSQRLVPGIATNKAAADILADKMISHAESAARSLEEMKSMHYPEKAQSISDDIAFALSKTAASLGDLQRSLENKRDIATRYVLERLAKAGIEVVTDKDEFEKALANTQRIQRMSEDVEKIKRLNERLSEAENLNAELSEKAMSELVKPVAEKLVELKDAIPKKRELYKESVLWFRNADGSNTNFGLTLMPHQSEKTKSLEWQPAIVEFRSWKNDNSMSLFEVYNFETGKFNDGSRMNHGNPLYSFEKHVLQFATEKCLPIIEETIRNKIGYLKQKNNAIFSKLDEQKTAKSVKEDIEKNSDTIAKDLASLDKSLRFNSTFQIPSGSLADEVTVFPGATGQNGMGIRHLIEERTRQDGLSQDEVAALSVLVLDCVRHGEITRDSDNRCEITKGGIVAIVRKDFDDEKKNWILTGFAYNKTNDMQKNREATEAIQTVIAKYGQSPDYSYFRRQVGAVVASLEDNISQERPAVNKKTQFLKTVSEKAKEKEAVERIYDILEKNGFGARRTETTFETQYHLKDGAVHLDTIYYGDTHEILESLTASFQEMASDDFAKDQFAEDLAGYKSNFTASMRKAMKKENLTPLEVAREIAEEIGEQCGKCLDELKALLKENSPKFDKEYFAEWYRRQVKDEYKDLDESQIEAYRQELENTGSIELSKTITKSGNPVLYYAKNETVYGFAANGKIYLNPEIMDSNVAVHEYTHLWDEYIKRENPSMWGEWKNIVLSTHYADKVRNDKLYADIKDDDDLVASEIHARMQGVFAKRMLEEIAASDGEITAQNMADWGEKAMDYVAQSLAFDKRDVERLGLKTDPEKAKQFVAAFLALPMNALVSGRSLQTDHRTLSEKILDELSNPTQEIKDEVVEFLADQIYNDPEASENYAEALLDEGTISQRDIDDWNDMKDWKEFRKPLKDMVAGWPSDILREKLEQYADFGNENAAREIEHVLGESLARKFTEEFEKEHGPIAEEEPAQFMKKERNKKIPYGERFPHNEWTFPTYYGCLTDNERKALVAALEKNADEFGSEGLRKEVEYLRNASDGDIMLGSEVLEAIEKVRGENEKLSEYDVPGLCGKILSDAGFKKIEYAHSEGRSLALSPFETVRLWRTGNAQYKAATDRKKTNLNFAVTMANLFEEGLMNTDSLRKFDGLPKNADWEFMFGYTADDIRGAANGARKAIAENPKLTNGPAAFLREFAKNCIGHHFNTTVEPPANSSFVYDEKISEKQLGILAEQMLAGRYKTYHDLKKHFALERIIHAAEESDFKTLSRLFADKGFMEDVDRETLQDANFHLLNLSPAVPNARDVILEKIRQMDEADEIPLDPKAMLEYPSENTEIVGGVTFPNGKLMEQAGIYGSDDLGVEREANSSAVRALEIAAAGGHNVLFYGHKNSPMTMLARTLAKAKPLLSQENAMKNASVLSAAGIIKTGSDRQTLFVPPFREVEPEIEVKEFCGGGTKKCVPGEISLANKGVLFVRDADQAKSTNLQTLRPAIENGAITLTKAGESRIYPADFQLAVTASPSADGLYGEKSSKMSDATGRTWKKILGPLHDRIELKAPATRVSDNMEKYSAQSLRESIAPALKIQQGRGVGNAELFRNPELFERHITEKLSPECKKAGWEDKINAVGANTLSFDEKRMIRNARTIAAVARTIADLEGSDTIELSHMNEAERFFNLDPERLFERNNEFKSLENSASAEKQGTVLEKFTRRLRSEIAGDKGSDMMKKTAKIMESMGDAEKKALAEALRKKGAVDPVSTVKTLSALLEPERKQTRKTKSNDRDSIGM